MISGGILSSLSLRAASFTSCERREGGREGGSKEGGREGGREGMKVEGKQKEGRKGGRKGLKSPQRMSCLHNRESYDFELRANIHSTNTKEEAK